MLSGPVAAVAGRDNYLRIEATYTGLCLLHRETGFHSSSQQITIDNPRSET